jgi:DNA-binding CsgD family transcriptional regulator
MQVQLAERLKTLTRRESEVLDYLVKGLTTDQIALALFRSPKTIDKHCQNIYQKTGIHKRLSLVTAVLRLGNPLADCNESKPDIARHAVNDIIRKSRAWDKMTKYESMLSRSSGPGYFGDLVIALAGTFGVKMAGISEVHPDEGTGDIIAFCVDGELQVPLTYSLDNSLCGTTFQNSRFEYLDNLRERFGDEDCKIPEMGYDSYVGVRLDDKLMGPIGVLWIAHDKQIDESEMVMEILNQFAPSVAAELATQIAIDANA